MARRMADPAFRKAQWEHRYDPHIAPVNHLVDELRKQERGCVPYVPPMYGGVSARLLSVLCDPGPMTQEGQGSGFISMENDDPTAEAVDNYFANAGIGAMEIVPWNAYPWYINRVPRAAELKHGTGPLLEIVKLLPDLRIVMVHGVSAQQSWKYFARRFGSLPGMHGIRVISTYHTSRQAFWHSDPSVREARREHLRNAFAEAAAVLNGGRDGG